MTQITVKAARVNAGLTQAEAAKRLGISRSALIVYEKDPKKIRLEMLAKMRVIYHMDDRLFFKV